MNSNKLNKRALVAFFMLFSLAILPFSGLMLHEASLHDVEKLQFLAMALHNVAAIVFTISALVHLKYNWRPLTNYIRNRKDRLIKYSKEMVIAGATLSILLTFSVLHVTNIHW